MFLLKCYHFFKSEVLKNISCFLEYCHHQCHSGELWHPRGFLLLSTYNLVLITLPLPSCTFPSLWLPPLYYQILCDQLYQTGHRSEISWNPLSAAVLFHLTQPRPSLSLLLQMIGTHSFVKWYNSSPLWRCTLFSSSIHQLVAMWVVSTSSGKQNWARALSLCNHSPAGRE